MAKGNGSLEVFFEYVASESLQVAIVTNITGLGLYADPKLAESPLTLLVNLDNRAGSTTWLVASMKIGDSIVEVSDYLVGSTLTDTFKLRVFFADDQLALYCNSKLVYFYGFTAITYPTTIELSLWAFGAAAEFLKIRRPELKDRRNAVYVDYEATADSAIQSVIQQRPVQVLPNTERAIDFTYDAYRAIVPAHHINRYVRDTQNNGQISSDGIVYSADVEVSISMRTAREVGLVTKLYRLSDLDNGARQAAATYQEQAIERRNMPTIIMRLDPRIEIGDRVLVDYIATGTQRHIEDDIIVEDTQITYKEGEYSLTVSGRRNL